jgi:hypothetical protein
MVWKISERTSKSSSNSITISSGYTRRWLSISRRVRATDRSVSQAQATVSEFWSTGCGRADLRKQKPRSTCGSKIYPQARHSVSDSVTILKDGRNSKQDTRGNWKVARRHSLLLDAKPVQGLSPPYLARTMKNITRRFCRVNL